MIIQIFFVLLTTLTRTNAVSLALAGYVASSDPVRGYLVNSGLGNEITRGALSLYDASGFRYISDQGTTIRKAQLKNHTLVELTDDHQRNGSFQQRISNVEDRKYSERLFNVLSEMDKKTCVARLVCEIGADPLKFGFLGLKIKHYLQSIPPVTWNSRTFAYKEAFHGGLSKGRETCLQTYSNCTSDLRKAMSWLMMKRLKL